VRLARTDALTGGRVTAREALEDRIAHLRAEADRLEVLLAQVKASAILAEPDAEYALWQLVTNFRMYGR
jgi:hypothetical protein